MTHTPFFPAWRAVLAPLGGSRRQATAQVRSFTLAQLEERFASLLPARFFAKAPSGPNSRERIYSEARTFWCFLWQVLSPGTACREVVRQLQALFRLHNGPPISQEDGAYCRARARLREASLPQALEASAQAATKRASRPVDFLQGRPFTVSDGTTVTLPDTKKNQKAFPKVQATTNSSNAFPMMRLVAFFCLASGAVLSVSWGSLLVSEMRLFKQMLGQLAQGDIIIADRGFGHYVILWLLRAAGVDFIGRSTRKVDGRRRLKRLARNDWLVSWRRPLSRSALLSQKEWSQISPHMTVRVVRGSLYQKGFRVREVTLVTTLLDPALYPAEQILRAYPRRWRTELCFDDLKTTLGMEMLRGHSPAMVRKEVYLHLIAHNFIRWLMAEAARRHHCPLEEMSFKGALDSFRQFSYAMCQARTRRQREQLWAELLRTLAADRLPQRPGRREPRAVKRRKNKYPRLDRPRQQFRDLPKRNVRRSIALRRNLLNKP